MWRYFNTGDQIWMEWRHGKWEVVRVLGADGVTWSEREEGLQKLSGMEKFFHRIEVTCLKLAWKVLQAG